jgi:hypothetical protein
MCICPSDVLFAVIRGYPDCVVQESMIRVTFKSVLVKIFAASAASSSAANRSSGLAESNDLLKSSNVSEAILRL